MSPSPLSVSVIIPAKNGCPTIGPCLDAVLAQEYEGVFDVLVIDSGSTDGTLEVCAERPDVQLHQIHPLAFDHGDTRNLGAALSTGDALVFLVQDAEPVGTSWLTNLVSNLEDPKVAGAFSRILPRPDAGPLVKRGCEQDLCHGIDRIEVSMTSQEQWEALDPHALRLACNFNDVSSVVRRDVWRRLPLCRGMFGEDIRFARSAIESGWTIVFDPTSEVLHSHEYRAGTIRARTQVDAVMNMEFLGRACVETLVHVPIMTFRSWKEDRRSLASVGGALGQRLRWTILSPLYHGLEFFGFWQGGRQAIREGKGRPGVRAPATRPAPDRPLKILMVAHGFPPDSWAGVEVLTLTLARALRDRGHEVVLFVRSPGERHEEDRSFSGVDETYRFAPAEAVFDRVLAEESPDVVHIQHMIHLSTGLVERCRRQNVPTVVTISDFWSRCPKVQRIRPDGKNCTLSPPGLACAACVKDHSGWVEPLAFLDRAMGGLSQWWANRIPQTVPAHPPGWKKSREDGASLVRRKHWMRDVLVGADRLVVPSATLKTSLIEMGIPGEKICLVPYGLATDWADGVEKDPESPYDGPMRVGFVGTPISYKGLSVLGEAVGLLTEGVAQLHVYGDHEGGADPVSAAEIAREVDETRRLAGDRVTFHGRFDHDDLGKVHAQLDVLVVPSLWQEAYGLTVREAHLSGTPVVGSRIAGIAEGIRDGVDGLLFQPGSAVQLSVALQRLLEDPTLGPRLAAAAPSAWTDQQEAQDMEWRYCQVIGAMTESGAS